VELPHHPGQVLDRQEVDELAVFVEGEVFDAVDLDLSVGGVKDAGGRWQVAGLGPCYHKADCRFIAIYDCVQVGDLDVGKWHSKASNALDERVATIQLCSIRVDVKVVRDQRTILVPLMIVKVLVKLGNGVEDQLLVFGVSVRFVRRARIFRLRERRPRERRRGRNGKTYGQNGEEFHVFSLLGV
jgi:hypothetical protein